MALRTRLKITGAMVDAAERAVAEEAVERGYFESVETALESADRPLLRDYLKRALQAAADVHFKTQS